LEIEAPASLQRAPGEENSAGVADSEEITK